MLDTQKQYLHLFNAMTSAIDAIDACNYGMAREILAAAQQQGEEAYLDAETEAGEMEAGETEGGEAEDGETKAEETEAGETETRD